MPSTTTMSDTLPSAALSEQQLSAETLSQLRIQIFSVRLPSTSKLVDIGVVMEIDNKYTYRTEIIRKKGRTSSLININESFDALVSVNSLINFKILAPTRLFGRHDLGQLEFNLKSIIEDYHSKEPTNSNESSPSYRVQLAYQNSSTVSNPFRSNVTNSPSSGMIEVIFSGTLLKQQEREVNQPVSEPVRSQRH